MTLDQHLLDNLFKQLAWRDAASRHCRNKIRSKTTADRQLRLEYSKLGSRKALGHILNSVGRRTEDTSTSTKSETSPWGNNSFQLRLRQECGTHSTDPRDSVGRSKKKTKEKKKRRKCLQSISISHPQGIKGVKLPIKEFSLRRDLKWRDLATRHSGMLVMVVASSLFTF